MITQYQNVKSISIPKTYQLRYTLPPKIILHTDLVVSTAILKLNSISTYSRETKRWMTSSMYPSIHRRGYMKWHLKCIMKWKIYSKTRFIIKKWKSHIHSTMHNCNVRIGTYKWYWENDKGIITQILKFHNHSIDQREVKIFITQHWAQTQKDIKTEQAQRENI